jgi:hypothetical protein
LIQDPTDSDRRYFGTNRVYRSTGNTSWTVISPDLTGGSGGGGSGQVRGTLTTLAVSPLDGNVIWAGADDGHVQVTVNGGLNWTDVSAALPERWITSVRCDPYVRETAYVTISGFRWAEPLPHVFRTTDLGANWEPIASDLPEAPVNEILIDPDLTDRYYVGTDVGVYITLNGGESWRMLGANLPRVVVTSLAFEPTGRLLIAGTYGRSFFAYALDQLTAVPETEPGDQAVARPGSEPAAVGLLHAPYPNPTGDRTLISWEMVHAAPVQVEIFTVSGRRIWSQTYAAKAGLGEVEWSGLDRRGRPAPAGLYLVRVSGGDQILGSNTIVLRR